MNQAQQAARKYEALNWEQIDDLSPSSSRCSLHTGTSVIAIPALVTVYCSCAWLRQGCSLPVAPTHTLDGH